MTQADSVHSTPPTNPSENNPPGGSKSPQDSLYRRTDISTEELFQDIGELRKRIERRPEISYCSSCGDDYVFIPIVSRR
jgi:hypothetical protein